MALETAFGRNQMIDGGEIGRHVELALEPPGVHVAHLAEDRPLGPGAVVQPERPGDIGVGIGIAPVEKVLVVQIQGGPKRRGRLRGALANG